MRRSAKPLIVGSNPSGCFLRRLDSIISASYKRCRVVEGAGLQIPYDCNGRTAGSNPAVYAVSGEPDGRGVPAGTIVGSNPTPITLGRVTRMVRAPIANRTTRERHAGSSPVSSAGSIVQWLERLILNQ